MNRHEDNTLSKFGYGATIVLQILLILGIIGGLYYFFRIYRGKTPGSIAIVGAETLYTQDLLHEKTKSPGSDEAALFERMVRSSVILQEGEKLGFVVLGPSLFNSPDKNQTARDQALAEVERQYGQLQNEQLTGGIVSVWFVHPGKDKSVWETHKAQAIKILEPYYERVTRGELSLEEAGLELSKNKELASLDPAYDTNTYYKFSGRPQSMQIASDVEFDTVLKDLKPGEFTPLHTLKISADGSETRVDAAFAFGGITAREQGTIVGFDEWIRIKRPIYSVEKL